jgi:putative ABC transport system permease protein
MSIFRVLNLRYVRRQPLRATLTVAAIAGAVAMTVASMILIASLDRSLAEAVKGVSGPAALRVIGPLTRGGVDPSVVRKVEATDGVATAVPVVHAVAVAQTVGGEPRHLLAIGVDCRIEALVGQFGCDARSLQARRDGPVLVSARLVREVGEGADIRTDQGRVPIRGAVVNDALDTTNSGRVAVFDLQVAQRLFDRGRNFDAIYIVPKKGADLAGLRSRLEGAVGPTNLVLRGDEPAPWMTSRGPLIPLLMLGLVMGIGLSMLLVYNILSLALADRRRDLAVAGAIGTSPRRLVAGIVGEAALLGLVGGLIGIAGGLVVSRPMVTSFATLISEQATGLKVNVHVPGSAPIVGLLIGALVGAASTFVPARRALRIDLAAELHGRAVLTEDAPRRSFLRAALLLGAAAITMGLSALSIRDGALAPWQPPLGALCLILAAVLVFAAVGALAPIVIVGTLRFLRNTGGPLRVAMANLVSRPRRTSVIATAVGAAVGLACVLGALIPATRATILKSELAGTDASVSVTTLPLNNSSNIDTRPSPELIAALKDVPGVASLNYSHESEVTDDEGVYSVRTFGHVKRWPFETVRGETGNAPLDRGEAILGTSIARARGLRPGSTLQVATPTGYVPLRIAGIWNSSFDNGYNVTVAPEVFEKFFGTPAPHWISVRAEPGVSPTELARRIELARIDPDANVMTGHEATNALADEIADQAAPFWTLQRLLLFVALVGTLSTLLLVGVQRRRELGVLGAVGFSPMALGRMTLTEALAAGFAGSVLGIIGSLAVFQVLRNASAVSIGVRTEYRFEPLSALAATALAAVVVAAGAALPAWRAARVQVVEAIRDE